MLEPTPQTTVPIGPAWSEREVHLRTIHAAALAAADPALAVERALHTDGSRILVDGEVLEHEPGARIVLVAFGKASRGMARAALTVLGSRMTSGLVVHPHESPNGSRDPSGAGWPDHVTALAAGHPLPDAHSLLAGRTALERVRGLSPQDLVLVLVSGGGSALFEALRPGLELEEARAVTEAMQRAGADIVELNVLRRALSLVKGGGLARASLPARVVTLVLSDVVGDRLDVIASGPTIESPGRPADALAILARRGMNDRFPRVVRVLEAAAHVENPTDVRSDSVVAVVGSNRLAGAAACREAEALGFRASLLTDRMQGEAREIGRTVGGLARGMRESRLPFAAPGCLVLGGETTVTVRGGGRGGRTLELALGAAQAMEGCPEIALLSVATDGLDGSSGAAGAVVTGDTLRRARDAGQSAERALSDSDTAPFFARLGDLWITGGSGTNVNDLAIALAY